MNSKHFVRKTSQRYQPSGVIQEKHFRDSMELLEEPDSFVDALNFSESDGYLEMPMLRTVPSHDLQELFIRKPVASSVRPQITPQNSRCCFHGTCPHAAELVYDFKPRIPAHLKMNQPRFQSYATQFASSISSKMQTTNSKESKVNNVPPLESSLQSEPYRKFLERHPIGRFNRSAMPYKNPRLYHRHVQAPRVKRVAPLYESLHYEPKLHTTPEKTSLEDMPQILEKTDGREDNNSKTLPDESNSFNDFEVKKMNSQGDAGQCEMANLDSIEKIVATLDENEANYLSENQKEEIKEMSKFLVPRAPRSVTGGQDESSQKPVASDDAADSKLTRNDSSESLRQSLDSILDQLENCEVSLNAVKSKYSNNLPKLHNEWKILASKRREIRKTKSIHVHHINLIENCINRENDTSNDIFSLREIFEKLSNIQIGNNVESQVDEPQVTTSDVSRKSSVVSSQSSTGATPRKSTMDDVSASELHRSKSYIVNLIDRALSKELGTVSREMLKDDQFQDFTLSKAISQIQRQSMMMGNSSEINEENPGLDLVAAKKSTKSFNNDGDPPYVKQLKELRWGHFKHIQQEFKRLEDIERFLDSCNPGDASD